MLSPRAPSEPLDAAALIRARLRDTGWQPPVLPTEALEVHRLSMQPLPSPAPVLDALQRSAFLSSEVLRASRTAAYAGARPPRNLQEAVVRLGTRSLADLVMEIALRRRVFRAPGYSKAAEGVRRNAVASAHAARTIALRTGSRQGIAFLGGLLHPAGYAIALVVLGSEPRHRRPGLADAWRSIETVNVEARRLMLRTWGMPDDLRAVLGMRDPQRDDLRAVAASVHLGNVVGAAMAPLPLAGEKEDLKLDQLGAVLAYLGIDAAEWPKLEAKARAAAAQALLA